MDPTDTIDCAFAVLRQPMVSEWDLCTGPYRPVHEKIKYNTLENCWEENNEEMKFYFRGLTSGRMTTTITSCHHTLRHDDFMYHNLLVLQEPSSDGDSGALVVTEEGDKAIGIIFARKTINNVERALAASIEDVEKSLPVFLVKRLTELQYD